MRFYSVMFNPVTNGLFLLPANTTWRSNKIRTYKLTFPITLRNNFYRFSCNPAWMHFIFLYKFSWHFNSPVCQSNNKSKIFNAKMLLVPSNVCIYSSCQFCYSYHSFCVLCSIVHWVLLFNESDCFPVRFPGSILEILLYDISSAGKQEINFELKEKKCKLKCIVFFISWCKSKCSLLKYLLLFWQALMIFWFLRVLGIDS